MIALALLSVILALLFGSFFQISESAKGLDRSLAERQEQRLLLAMVVDDLQNVVFLEGFKDPAGQQRETGIVGRTERFGDGDFSNVRFHSAIAARFHRQVLPAQEPGLHEVAYWVQESDDRRTRLLMRREDLYIDDDLEHGGTTVELARDVEAFLVEFLPRSAADSESADAWEREWNPLRRPAGDPMPIALRLTLGLRSASGRAQRETYEINLPYAPSAPSAP
ncbi:MAG: hypothetical protein HY423_16370 [Candidatus Lambdaproteobacteria bacterium]|nr:hypothetical protein [Candidatus Lambdaproteobacteria bacterium]